VHTENSLVNDSRDGQVVEHSAEVSPHRQVVPALALVVESIHPGDRVALVVASEKVNHVGVLHFVGQQKTDGLDALLPAVNEVAD